MGAAEREQQGNAADRSRGIIAIGRFVDARDRVHHKRIGIFGERRVDDLVGGNHQGLAFFG